MPLPPRKVIFLKNNDSYNLRKIFVQIELDLAKSLKRTLKLHESEEKKEGFKWEQWQEAKLRNIREYRKGNKKIVSDKSKSVERIVKDAMQGNYKDGQNLFQKITSKIARRFASKGTLTAPVDTREAQQGIPLEEQTRKKENDFFHINDKKIEALQGTVDHDLKKAQSAVLRKMDDVYRQTIYKAEMHMSAGAKTLDQAIDMATKEFLEKGINCIEYKDGKRVNIVTYAEMALRTASHRATLLGEGKKRDEWGIHTVVVSAHANTCPKCEKWQGMVLVDDVFSGGAQEEAIAGGYYLLSFAIEAGLLHPNCRHTISTYFPGITQIPTIPDGKAAVRKYQAEQEQRRLEREIRKWKRIAEGSQDSENMQKANNELQEYQKQLREHLEKHPYLRRDYSREKIRLGTPQSKHAANVSRNTFAPVRYSPENDYSINIAGYPDVVNAGLSEASRKVAELGGKDGFEHLQLVDLRSGELGHYETNNEPNSVGEKSFWSYVSNNSNKNYAFIHNHNTDSSFSEMDLRTLLTTENIPVMIAVRNDGVKYIAERESICKTSFFDELYEKELAELSKLVRDGEITISERGVRRELLIVNNLLRDYTKGKGLIEVDGRKDR